MLSHCNRPPRSPRLTCSTATIRFRSINARLPNHRRGTGGSVGSFVGDLLIFSLGYAGWVRLRHGHPRHLLSGELRIGHLLVLAAVVAIATFVVRLGFPVESEKYVDLNLYEWPAAIALFSLGVPASQKGWLTAVPPKLHARCRTVRSGGRRRLWCHHRGRICPRWVGEETWAGGWHWHALAFAAFESILAVFGPVWMLAVAQRHLNGAFRWRSAAIRRSAYGAFMLQGLVLIGLAAVLRPLPIPAEAKALVVATGGVGESITLARLLIRRVPGVARIL